MDDFIKIGDVRIKRSNIASFGVAARDAHSKNLTSLELGALFLLSKFSKKIDDKLEKALKPTQYLYVTTYQKDNYTFTDKDVDISIALADLEKSKINR